MAFVMVMIFFPAVVILVLIGMVPTIVAYAIDKTPGKYAMFCVGGINFTGVFPALTDLWSGNPSISASLKIAGDPFSLILMYGAAGLGWAIYMFIPPIISAGLAVAAQHRIQQLRSDQRALIQEWGPAIAATHTPVVEGEAGAG
jgi:hypothetical protein